MTSPKVATQINLKVNQHVRILACEEPLKNKGGGTPGTGVWSILY